MRLSDKKEITADDARDLFAPTAHLEDVTYIAQSSAKIAKLEKCWNVPTVFRTMTSGRQTTVNLLIKVVTLPL
jgi:hypothetical protein